MKSGDAVPRRLGRLVAPDAYRSAVDDDSRSGADLLGALRRMLLIRRTEEVVASMVETGEARCPCHLAIGQEATAVGVARALEPGQDKVFGAHRSHAHYLALGGRVEDLFAEILGKDTGCSRGMGGSMHVVAPELGLMGTVPIVGASIPLAVGAGLALKMDGDGGVAVPFFGDGATEEGVFHESLNLASSMALPVVFVCENNLFSSHLHITHRQPADSVARFAWAHDVPSSSVDGNDVAAVWRHAEEAVERARSGAGPSLLELVTYRWRGHVGHREDLDVGVERGKELPEWKERDPIRRLRDGLESAGKVAAGGWEEMRGAVDAEVERALAAARAAPYPPLDAPDRYLWGEVPAR